MEKRGGRRRGAVQVYLVFGLFFLFLSGFLHAALGPSDVLILVNAQSRTSRYIAKMYRWYYPAIQDWQVVLLEGLADCSGPNSTAADEILTREQYNNLIAGPVRSYLLAHGIEKQIKVIITTAGMPYRIEDTKPNFANVIYPGGSNWQIVMSAECQVDAASVESELTCLWYLEEGNNPCPIENRIVNPYQGCRSGFDLFERQMPYADDLVWSFAWSRKPGVDDPYMEGTAYGYGTINRRFGPGRMYLVSRLDGPKNQGKSAVFSVRAMLERAKRASSPQYGVNPQQAVVVLDDAPKAPSGDLDYNRVFNLHDSSVNFWEYQGVPWPPDAYGNCAKNDYVEAFNSLSVDYFAEGSLYFGALPETNFLPVILDYRERKSFASAELALLDIYFPGRTAAQGVIGFSCFGMNGDEGRAKTYLLNGGADGGVLFLFLNGAVFTSLESFNAVTMFSDVSTTQAKIIDFIQAGGTAAIGHSFEPQSDAAIDNQFLYSNLLADRDGDGRADLTFVEAAWSAIPYLSWSEVVIGDPLMRIAYGPGQPKPWNCLFADTNMDKVVNFMDVYILYYCYGGILNSVEDEWYEKYYDLADVDKNAVVNSMDLYIIRYLYSTIYE